VHNALVDCLGVKRLIAAVGGCVGSVRSLEWGALYTEFVEDD